MNDKTEIIGADLGWSDSVVMICSTCGKQFENSKLADSPERIKKELKSLTKERLGKAVRVITTSCLNICPKDKIAIVKGSKSKFEAINVDPEIPAEQIFEHFFK